MNWVCAFILVLSTCCQSFAQQSLRDSLAAVIQSNVKDTTIMKAKLTLAEQLWYRDPDTAFGIASEVLEEARDKGYKLLEARSMYHQGGAMFIKRDFPKAKKYMEKTLVLMREVGFRTGEANTLTSLGIVVGNIGDAPAALEYYAQALKLNEETANKKGIASTLLNIGTVYETKGDYPAALKYFLEALTLIQELQNKIGEAFVLNNLGVVYCKMKDFRTGIDHYNKACVVNREIGNKNALTRTLYNIAMTHLDQGEYERAREKIEEALPLMEELGDEEGIASILGSLGKIMIKAGDYESAQANLDRAMEIHIRIEDYNGIAKLYLDYAQMNLQRKDFDTSIQKANEALRRYTELEGIEGVKVAHEILSATYEEMGNFKLAYDHHLKFANFKDSLFSEDKSKEIGRLEAKYEFENAQTDKKRIENERIAAEMQAENRRNNLQHSGILIFLVMLSGGIMVLGNLAIPVRLVEGLIFLTFLLFFEFTLVLLDPYIEEYSSGAPAYKLMFNAAMAGLIFPLHSLFETQLKGRLVKRN